MKTASLEATKWNKSLWATVVFIQSYTVTYWLVEKAFPDKNLFNFYKNIIVVAAPMIIHNDCEPT